MKMYKRIVICFLIILLSVAGISLYRKNTMYKGTCIAIEDLTLYNDSNLSVSTQTIVEKHSLIYAIEQDQEAYYVQLPVYNPPASYGWVKKEGVSFDKKLFNEAITGRAEKAKIYNSPTEEDVYDENYTGVLVIKQQCKKNKMVQCSLVGGVDDKWIRCEDVKYKLDLFQDN